MSVALVAAAVLAFLLGLAHSALGERFILVRLFRRPLPPLFGDDTFTRRTLRFAWHLTTFAWWGAALLLAFYAHVGVDAGAQIALGVLTLVFAASAALTAVGSRGRHLAWVAMAAIAALSGWGASG